MKKRNWDFNMTQITKKEVFVVDGMNFPTEEDAQNYIKQRDGNKSVLEYNTALLDNHGDSFIPVYDPEEQSIDIFIKTEVKNGGNWKVWQSLIKDRELRYYTEKLNILSPDDFMAEFQKYPSLYIDTNEWNSFLFGLIEINQKCKIPLDWREVIGLIAQMQVTPQYIYSD